MTYYTLKKNHETTHPEGHFFDADTLKFFGERESDMRVLKNTEIVIDYNGKEHECYVLSSYQRKYPTGARRVYHYFDTTTFDCVSV